MEDSITENAAPAEDENGSDEAMKRASVIVAPSILEDIENHYVGIRQERDHLQMQLQEALGKLEGLSQSVVDQEVWEIKAGSYKQEIASATSKIEALREDRKLMQEIMDRLQADGDGLRDEARRLHQTNSELTKQASELEIKCKLAGSDSIPLLNEKQRLTTELSSLQSHTNWLEQELSSKSTQYQNLQRESRSRTVQLQQQLDQAVGEKDVFSSRLEALEMIERKLHEQVKQLSLGNMHVKQELVSTRQNLEEELHEERRVIQLQKEHIHRWEQRYEDVSKENDSLKVTSAQALEMYESELKSEREKLERKFTALLEEQAGEYEGKLMQITGASENRLTLPVSTTPPTRKTQDEEDGPMSMTDLYERLVRTENELRKEQKDRKCWQLQFMRVQKEIKDMAPRLIRQREEYELAVDQLTDYQRRLEMALSEREGANTEASNARSMAALLQNRLAEQQAESRELAVQVQTLLVSRGTNQSDPNTAVANIPTSVQEMQNQNQRLLTEHRQLTQKVTELEDQLQTNTLRHQLERTTEELMTLNRARQEQESFVERIVQQRDLYRALLAKHDSTLLGSESEEVTALEMSKVQSERARHFECRNKELEEEIKSLQSLITKTERDKDDAVARFSRQETHANELMKSLDLLERDLITSRSSEARVSAELQYHKENNERLQLSLDRARSETSHVTSAKNELQRINTELQELLSNTKSQLGVLESERRQVENKLKLLQAQLETSLQAEKRTNEENAQLKENVSSQVSLIDSFRRVESQLLSNNDGEKELLRNDTESLKKRLAEESLRYKTDFENWQIRAQQMEENLVVLTSSSERSKAEVLAASEKITSAEIEITSLTSKCENLETQLAAAKEKLEQQDPDSEAEVTTQAKLDQLETEIEALNKEREGLINTAENYKKLSKDHEMALVDLQTQSNTIQSQYNEEVESLKRSLDNYKQVSQAKDDLVKDLTNDLSNHRKERDALVQELQGQISSLEAQIQSNEIEVQSAKATTAALSHDMASLRDEIRDSQNNFERELGLHSQARTALRSARETADDQSRLRIVAEEKLEELNIEMKEKLSSWDIERVETNKTIELLEKRINESQQQNSLLYSQLDALNEAIAKSHISSTGVSSELDLESNDANLIKATSELKDLIKFLRGENDLLQTQLDTAQRKADREKATSTVLRRSLDEAQNELIMFRSESSHEGDIDKSFVALEEKLRCNEEQMRLLQDSNRLLREEGEKLETEYAVAKKELEAAAAASVPLTDAQRRLEGSVSALSSEKASLERELEAWKDRVKNLVSKFEQIDPEEHRILKEQVVQLKKENESLTAWKKTTEEESARIKTIAKNLNQKNREQKTMIDIHEKELEKLKSEKISLARSTSTNSVNVKELEELKVKISKMTEDAQSKSRELEGANSRNDRLREKLREYLTLIRDLRETERSLNEQLSNAKTESTSKTQNAKTTEPSVVPKPVAPVDHMQKRSVPIESEKVFPTIPEDGFYFGPSAVHRAPIPKTEPLKKPEVSPLRAVAPAFTPPAKPVDPISEVTSSDPSTTSKEIDPSGNIVDTATSDNPLPTSNKESSMKEILLAKKKELQEKLLKRKLEVESSSPKPDVVVESDAKRTKLQNDQVAARNTGEQADVETDVGLVNSAPIIPVEQTVPSKEPADALNEGKEVVLDATTSTSQETPPESNTDQDIAISSKDQSTPFGTVSSETSTTNQPAGFGQSAQVVPAVFGQSAQVVPAVFGQSTTLSSTPSSFSISATKSNTFGSSFLEIKPAGTSTNPPSFQFGSSASIILPTPTIPASNNPFGAFNTNTSFGGFGSPPSTMMPSIPLFTASPAQPSKPLFQLEEGDENKANDSSS